MPDCYQCGAYIERGRGHRRHVEIESSTRVYVSRRGGGSHGSRSALRTLCRTCAEVSDAIDDGAGQRIAIYVIGYGVSVWLGWNLLTEGSGLVAFGGLLFILGIPLSLGGYAFEQMRRTQIAREISSRKDADPLVDLNLGRSTLDHAASSGTVRHDDIEVEIASLARAVSSDGGDNDLAFMPEDTIAGWASRIAAECARAGVDFHETSQRVVDLAKVTRPKIGETAIQFAKRAGNQIDYLKSNAADPSFRLLAEGESGEDWVRRTGPLYYFSITEDGKSCEDTLAAFLPLARVFPPGPAEDLEAWLFRVEPLIKSVEISD